MCLWITWEVISNVGSVFHHPPENMDLLQWAGTANILLIGRYAQCHWSRGIWPYYEQHSLGSTHIINSLWPGAGMGIDNSYSSCYILSPSSLVLLKKSLGCEFGGPSQPYVSLKKVEFSSQFSIFSYCLVDSFHYLCMHCSLCPQSHRIMHYL